MRRLLGFVVTVAAVAGSSIACSQSPAGPSPNGLFGSGTLSTIVDVPITVDVTEGLVGTWNYVGQSVTIPAGASVGNVRFAWYHYNPRGETTAFGRIYVLDREYLGLPGDLSPSTAGYLSRSEPEASGMSNAQGSEYTLPSTLTLSAKTKYWFYTDKQGAFANSFDKDIYPGGSMWHTGYYLLAFYPSKASGRMVNGVFVPAPPGVTIDANFRLRGTAR